MDLPEELGQFFRVSSAAREGVRRGVLDSGNLERPYWGVRATVPLEAIDDHWDARRAELLWRGRSLLPRLNASQFFAHDVAMAAYGGPVRLAPSDEADLVDVTTRGDGPMMRGRGIRPHRTKTEMSLVRNVEGLPVGSPATVWVLLGATRSVEELVQIGDFFCRVWREGYKRPMPGLRPLATVEHLEAALRSGRRRGAGRLRQALALIRCDSWSPLETSLRLAIVWAGLPEPQLNRDVYADGRFLACVDLCYPELKIAIEYQGEFHEKQYVQDEARAERLRAAGWIVILVTAEHMRDREALIRLIGRAMISRGLVRYGSES